MCYTAVRPAVASIKGKTSLTCYRSSQKLTRIIQLARTFATASRATASAGSRHMAMATAGVVTASALSYAYLQSKCLTKQSFDWSRAKFSVSYLEPVAADSKPVACVK